MAETHIHLSGTQAGYERLKAIGPEKLTEMLQEKFPGIKVTSIGPFDPERRDENTVDWDGQRQEFRFRNDVSVHPAPETDPPVGESE